MFKIKYKSRDTKKGNWCWARSNGNICKFMKRQNAINWCRNHRYLGTIFDIVHPDGTRETWRNYEVDPISGKKEIA